MSKFSGKKCRLLTMLSMTFSFFLVELIVGYVTNSMALVADSFHMLSDVLALLIAFLSVKMSPKKWSKNTFGWARAEVLGALVNSVFLLALCFSIFVESLKRIYEPEQLHTPQLILCIGVLGLIVNLIGLCLFHEHGHGHSHGGHGHSHGGHGHSHHMQSSKHLNINALVATDDNENDERFTSPPHTPLANEIPGPDGSKKQMSSSQMNMRGVFLHVLSDALGSVIVIVSALIVWLTEWEYSEYIDPILSLCLVLLISYSTWPLLRESALILLQTVPTHIQVDSIQKQLLNVDGVLAVHEFHVWQLAGEKIIASAHIRCRNLKDYMVLAESIKKMFHEEGIHSTTIQPEFVEFEDDTQSLSIESTEDCILDCPSKDKEGCVANTCCGFSKQVLSSYPILSRQPAVPPNPNYSTNHILNPSPSKPKSPSFTTLFSKTAQPDSMNPVLIKQVVSAPSSTSPYMDKDSSSPLLQIQNETQTSVPAVAVIRTAKPALHGSWEKGTTDAVAVSVSAPACHASACSEGGDGNDLAGRASACRAVPGHGEESTEHKV